VKTGHFGVNCDRRKQEVLFESLVIVLDEHSDDRRRVAQRVR